MKLSHLFKFDSRLNTAKKTSVCLVTNELYPFAPGGIGRLMYNWILQNASNGMPVDLHLLLHGELLQKADKIRDFCATYTVKCHFCDDKDLELTKLGRVIAPQLRGAWDYLHPYRIAYQTFATLLRLERAGVTFDIVEFPDYGGWGAITIEAKRATLAFAKTQLCVRLHSSYGIIVATERFYHHPSGYGAGMVDLERFALLHADQVIAHQISILDFNCDFYKFDKKWLDKAIIETPPIMLDNFETERGELPVRRFVYSSRLQPFKRADLFIRAACLYYDRYFDDDSEAFIVSYGWDRTYIDSLIEIVPDRLRNKIKFCFDVQGEARQALLAGAVIVIPSDYESYCLFAYETAAMGRRVLLRRDCLAFSVTAGWIDGKNCLHFGSEPADLAAVMRDALDWQPQSHRVTQPSEPYWVQLPRVAEVVPARTTAMNHEVIVQSVGSIEDAIRVVNLCTAVRPQIITLIIEAHFDAALIRKVFESDQQQVHVYVSPYHDNYFADVWAKVASSKADIVTVLQAHDEIDPLYLSIVERAFSFRPELDLITSNEGLVDGQSGSVLWLRPVAGEHLVSGLSGLSTVGRLFSVRPQMALKREYPKADRNFATAALFGNAALANCSLCVLPDIYCTTLHEVALTRDPRWLATKVSDLSAGTLAFGSGMGLSLSSADSSSLGAILRINAEAHMPAQRLLPSEPEPWGDPVSYDELYGGLVVHPVDQSPTIARIALPGRGILASMLFVDVENAHGENDGFQIVIFPGAFDNINSLLREMDSVLPVGCSATLAPHQKATLRVSVDPFKVQTHFYVVSRKIPEHSAHNCHAIVSSYGAVV